jgi:serine/threonine-protein kinase
MDSPRGQLLAGKYEPIKPAGRGGMASVWLGLTHGEAGFRRRVAIKRLLQHRSKDAEFAHMFVEEARVVAELNHPNIVQIHDFGVDEYGCYFIVMEWVDGLSLDRYAGAFARRGRRTPWYLVAAISIEVLRALRAAHERVDEAGNPAPVIHRDVAPANILVGKNGIVKLADFGLSRATDRPSRTAPGVVKGKVSYIAPEVLEARSPSVRSDIYSMGVVMWETLSMRHLFGGDGTDVAIAMRVLKAKIPDLSELRPDVPEPLIAVVRRALAKDPDARFESAGEMLRALTTLLRELPHRTGSEAISESVKDTLDFLARAVPGPGSFSPLE